MLGRERRDRQLHDLIDRTRAVVVVGGRSDLAAPPSPCVPRPRRVSVDERKLLARRGKGDEIINRAAVFDQFAMALLCTFDLGLFDEAVRDAVIGALAGDLDLGLEVIFIQCRELRSPS